MLTIYIKDYFHQKRKSNIYQFNQSKIEKIEQEIAFYSDTLLKFYFNDIVLCDSNCNDMTWLYKSKTGINLQVVEYGFNRFKMSEPKKHTIPEAKILFDYIDKHRLDTVNSRIKTDLWCDHCGGLYLLYKVKNDTILDRYIDHGELANGDTTHLLHKYARLVLSQLAKFENKYR